MHHNHSYFLYYYLNKQYKIKHKNICKDITYILLYIYFKPNGKIFSHYTEHISFA